MNIRSALMMGAVSGVVMSMSGVALAQSTDTGGIETVTVSARQYSESIQTAPLSVTALSANDLEGLFVQNLADVNHQAPNFTIQGVGAIHRNAAVVFSRGIGYAGVDMGQDPAVGVSVNGVFMPSNIGMLSNTLDVDNIQILRGPQGTLFGKNTVGGVVNITTKLPGDVYSVEAMVRVGNFGRLDFFGAADIPIDDTLAARITLQSQTSGGPFKNAYTPTTSTPTIAKHLGGDDIKTIRGTLLWNPVSNFTATLVGSYSKDRSTSVGGQNGSIPCSYATDPAYHGYCDALATYFGHPGFDYRTPGQPYPLGPNAPYTVYRNFPSGDYQDTTSVSLNARYHTDMFDVVSVTGFVRNGNLSYSDYGNTELDFFESTFGLDNRQWSQEFRLESNGDSPLKWVAGAIYVAKTWSGSQLFTSTFPTLDNYIDYAKQNDDSVAGFFQADYNVTSALQLTAGVRYTNERKDIERVNSHLNSLPLTPCDPSIPNFTTINPASVVPNMACTYNFKKSWGNATYHIGANYQIDPDKMLYASFSTGFVAGGFNTRVDSEFLTGTPYSPETAQAWEIGLKSDWYDHRLRVNAAAFLNKYSNMQVGAFIPGGGLQQAIVNNAYERAQGVELEITAIPVEHLTLKASVGLLDANYTSFNANVFGTGTADYSFLRPGFAPKWTMNYSASYDFDLNGHGVLTPSASVQIETSHFTDLTNNPVGYQPTYARLDASLVYNEPQGRWQVALWGKNLNNALYRLSAVPSSGYFTQLYFANPATYGMDLTFKM